MQSKRGGMVLAGSSRVQIFDSIIREEKIAAAGTGGATNMMSSKDTLQADKGRSKGAR
jgi:hypothetical protein